MPSPGIIKELRLAAGPFVRNDCGVESGSEVPRYYDPMIGKLAVWAGTREAAISRMRDALARFAVEGVKTNIPTHLKVLGSEAFARGELDTHFLERL